MECDRYDVLHEVVRIASSDALEYPQGMKKILCFLASRLGLEDARFLLYEPTQGRFLQVLSSQRPDLFAFCDRNLVFFYEKKAFDSFEPVKDGTSFHFPVAGPRRSFGVLTLRFPAKVEISPQLIEMTEAVCSQIGFLAQLHQCDVIEKDQGHSRRQLLALSAENNRKYRRMSLLYRMSRAMHSTLRINELMHLILSAVAATGGAGFERAMLFMVNERSGTLQGMLGVTRQSAALIFPPDYGDDAWRSPSVDIHVQNTQKKSLFCRQVMSQRLSLDAPNALAQSVREGHVALVSKPESESHDAVELARHLQLGPYACAPLPGRHGSLAVLVVDNPDSNQEISPDHLRFLELFAGQAGQAMENSMLVHRLETAHQELRETQERLVQGEKMAGLGEMAASVAHELKNPLVSIGGFAQRLARHAEEGSRDQQYADIIARETQRMEEMLSNILAFSKKQMLCFELCHIETIIDDAMALEGDQITSARIRLNLEVEKGLPPLKGDAQKLRQVVINLLHNACQAMPHGGALSLKAYAAFLRGDPAVTIEVEDTGGGIPDEVMRNIFNPFFTTKEGGTGLGLSISHRIVELHAGEFEVHNRGEGAVFIVRLPVGTVS